MIEPPRAAKEELDAFGEALAIARECEDPGDVRLRHTRLRCGDPRGPRGPADDFALDARDPQLRVGTAAPCETCGRAPRVGTGSRALNDTMLDVRGNGFTRDRSSDIDLD